MNGFSAYGDDVFKTYEVGSKSASEKLAQVNPNYSSGEYQWQHNCQKCIVAWELVQRGYLVTAKPFDPNDSIGSNGLKAWQCKGENWLEDDDLRSVTIKAWFKSKIKEAFEQWGEEARAAVFVEWAKGTKHAFCARKSNGKIIYEDPQLNIIRDIDATLEDCTDEHYRLWFMRTDNRDFTEAVSDAVTELE